MARILMLNGSPHEFGCTFTAQKEIGQTLQSYGIEYDIIWVGREPVQSCQACGGCSRVRGQCVFGEEDGLNAFLDNAKTADGFIFGSAVHYAGATGAISSFLSRAFYCGASIFQNKPGAAVVSCRRGGATAAFQQLSMYLFNMITVPTRYWGVIHGNTPEQVRRDEEGMQTMRALGANMAWLVRALVAAREAGIYPPEYEKRVFTNFIPRE